VEYDFKGNTRESKRDLFRNYRETVDWNSNPVVDGDSFTSSTEYDALNRTMSAVTPDKSIYRPAFNRANLLDKVDVCLRGESDDGGQLKWTSFVTNINYNAKGQRELIEYQNGAKTVYEYDEQTFRLIHLTTTRPAGRNGNASQIFADATVVQDLYYTFDPVGNITHLEDRALAPAGTQLLEAISEYKYDALYQLIEASGREHSIQTGFEFNPPGSNYRDFQFAGPGAHPNDLQALRSYLETYDYDPAGNFNSVSHKADNASWTRTYSYEERSPIESSKKSNRLTRTVVGSGQNQRDDFMHDAHGNITSMTHLSNLTWDFKDQLQQVDLGGGGTAFYVYDAGGKRIRKVIESQNGAPRNERIYLGGFEIYREYNGNYPAANLERETLHVVDDKQRIALVDTQTIKDGIKITDPVPLQRYQMGNHLLSASVELSADGSLISYEDFHPFGTTAFQVTNDSTEGSLKRYRYTGKERDAESGFYYHGARYYVVWIARWLNPDPAGLVDGLNLYCYVRNNPTRLVDPDGRRGATKEEQVIIGKLGDLETAAEKQFQKLSTGGQIWDYEFSGSGPARQAAHARANINGLKAAIERAGENERIVVIAEYGTIQVSDENGVIGEVPRFAEYLTEREYRFREWLRVGDAIRSSPISSVAYTTADLAGASPETRDKLALAGAPLWDMVSASAGMAQGAKQKWQQRHVRRGENLQKTLENEVLGGKGSILNKQATVSVAVTYTDSQKPTLDVSVNKGAPKSVVEQLRARAAQGEFNFLQGPGHAEPNLWSGRNFTRMDVFASNYNCANCVGATPPNVTLHDQKLTPNFRASGNPNMSISPDARPFVYEAPVHDPINELFGF
jgi:RHS repeat-associated protein